MVHTHHFYLAAPKHFRHPKGRPPPFQALPIAPHPIPPAAPGTQSSSFCLLIRLFCTFLRDGITHRVSLHWASLTERCVSKVRRPRSCLSALPLSVEEPRSALRMGLMSLPVRQWPGPLCTQTLLHSWLMGDLPPALHSAQWTWGSTRGTPPRNTVFETGWGCLVVRTGSPVPALCSPGQVMRHGSGRTLLGCSLTPVGA